MVLEIQNLNLNGPVTKAEKHFCPLNPFSSQPPEEQPKGKTYRRLFG